MANNIIRKLESPEFDYRLLDRHISEERITQAKYLDHLKDLPDLADEAEQFQVLLAQGDDPAPNADD